MSRFSDKFKFKQRPPNPWPFTKPAPVVANMTWHHIIPYALLRDVWSCLCDQHIDTALPAARVAIRQYLLLLNNRLDRVDELIARMRAETVQRIAGHNPLRPLDMGEIVTLQSTVAYPAWDLVEGPSVRSDDPHERSLDQFRVGLKPDEARQMRVIESLNAQLAVYASSPSSLMALGQAMSVAAMDLKTVQEPIRFRPEMWLKNPSTQAWTKAPMV